MSSFQESEEKRVKKILKRDLTKAQRESYERELATIQLTRKQSSSKSKSKSKSRTVYTTPEGSDVAAVVEREVDGRTVPVGISEGLAEKIRKDQKQAEQEAARNKAATEAFKEGVSRNRQMGTGGVVTDIPTPTTQTVQTTPVRTTTTVESTPRPDLEAQRKAVAKATYDVTKAETKRQFEGMSFPEKAGAYLVTAASPGAWKAIKPPKTKKAKDLIYKPDQPEHDFGKEFVIETLTEKKLRSRDKKGAALFGQQLVEVAGSPVGMQLTAGIETSIFRTPLFQPESPKSGAYRIKSVREKGALTDTGLGFKRGKVTRAMDLVETKPKVRSSFDPDVVGFDFQVSRGAVKSQGGISGIYREGYAGTGYSFRQKFFDVPMSPTKPYTYMKAKEKIADTSILTKTKRPKTQGVFWEEIYTPKKPVTSKELFDYDFVPSTKQLGKIKEFTGGSIKPPSAAQRTITPLTGLSKGKAKTETRIRTIKPQLSVDYKPNRLVSRRAVEVGYESIVVPRTRKPKEPQTVAPIVPSGLVGKTKTRTSTRPRTNQLLGVKPVQTPKFDLFQPQSQVQTPTPAVDVFQPQMQVQTPVQTPIDIKPPKVPQFDFTFPTPPLPKPRLGGGEFDFGKKSRPSRKPKGGYRPSLAGVLGETRLKKPPKGTLSGIEVRPKVRRKKRKKRKTDYSDLL